MGIHRKVTLLGRFFFLLIILSLMGSCLRTRSAPRGRIFVVGLESSPLTLDPRYAVDAYSTRILEMITPGLMKIRGDGRAVPDLLERVEILTPTILLLHPRPHLSFHNGTPITPERIAESLLLFRNMLTPKAQGLKEIASVTATTTSVFVTLARPFSPILTTLSIPLLPPEQMRAERITAPVGAGPFVLYEKKEDEIWLKSKDDQLYVQFRVYRDPLTLVYALERGEIDLAQNNILSSELPRLRKIPHLSIDEFPGWNVSYLGFRCDHPLLRFPEVRKAIAMAIPREEIISRILYNTAISTETLLPPQHWAFTPLPPIPYNPQQAKETIERILLSHRDELREKDRVLTYKTSTHPERIRIAQVIASELKKLGIEVRLQSLEFGTLLEQLQRGEFDLFSLTWVGVTEPDLLYYALHSRSIPPEGANRGRCTDPELDTLLEQARALYDPEERKRRYEKAQFLIHERLPVFPLWVHKTIIVRRAELKGFEPLPSGNYLPLLNTIRSPL
jgi:peptide/nickel transport system substrate-binding protein